MTTPLYTLSLSCKDRPGLVADVAGWVRDHQGNITGAHQFNDAETGLFFMRVQFETPLPLAALLADMRPFADQRLMQWRLVDARLPKRVLIMVSKFDHCLVDLLYRQRLGELNMQVAAIVSNHPADSLAHVDLGGIAFHHLPVSRETRDAQETALRAIIADTGAELVILARYMQILSNELSHDLAGRCINIHHSFLPGFKGARPYHQAHQRGVKMIGATAHYVTPDLDEGPIIAQDVEPCSHADSADDLVRKGRNIEQRVLAAAVRDHLEDRVILNGSKTVVFRA